MHQVSELTARDEELLRLASTGRDPAEIAAQLGISVNTVQCSLRHIFETVRVRTRLGHPVDRVVGPIAISRRADD